MENYINANKDFLMLINFLIGGIFLLLFYIKNDGKDGPPEKNIGPFIGAFFVGCIGGYLVPILILCFYISKIPTKYGKKKKADLINKNYNELIEDRFNRL